MNGSLTFLGTRKSRPLRTPQSPATTHARPCLRRAVSRFEAIAQSCLAPAPSARSVAPSRLLSRLRATPRTHNPVAHARPPVRRCKFPTRRWQFGRFRAGIFFTPGEGNTAGGDASAPWPAPEIPQPVRESCRPSSPACPCHPIGTRTAPLPRAPERSGDGRAETRPLAWPA